MKVWKNMSNEISWIMKDNQHSDQNNNSDVLRYICVSPDLPGLPLELMTPTSTRYIENESCIFT